MSYKLRVIRDFPTLYFPLEESSGTIVADVSGYSANGTYSAAPTVFYNPVVSNSARSAQFTANRKGTATLTTSIWDADTTNKSFSLEAWVLPQTVTGPNLIAGRGANNGLYITPTGFTFSIAGVTGTVSISYSVPRWNGVYHVVATYDRDVIYLFVNGIGVANIPFDTTISNTGVTNFQIGGINNGSDSIIISNVAFYQYALSPDNVAGHWNYGIMTADYLGMLAFHSSVYYLLDDTMATLAMDITEDTREEFATGTIVNLIYDNDADALTLFDTTQAGSRIIGYDIGEQGIIDGSRIDWDCVSPNFTLAVSLDGGTNWTNVSNHQTIPGLGEGVDTTGKLLLIRQSFAVGTDVPLLYRMRFVLYTNKNPKASQSDMTITAVEPYTLGESAQAPIRHNDYSTLKMAKSGQLIIPAATGDNSVNAVEMWVRRDTDNTTSGENNYFFDLRADDATRGWLAVTNTAGVQAMSVGGGLTFYINGVQKTPVLTDFPIGQWVHVLAVFATPLQGRIFVNSRATNVDFSNFSYRFITLFYDPPTATDAATHYAYGFGRPTGTVIDPIPGRIFEIGWTPYKNAWQTQGGQG